MPSSLMRLFGSTRTKKAKPKSISTEKAMSKSRSTPFTPKTQQKIDNFTRKRNIKRLAREGPRLFKTIQNEIEVEDTRCAICLGIMKHNDPITLTITKCKHKFHSACLEKWKEKDNRCPKCRTPLPKTELITPQITPLNANELVRLRFIVNYWTNKGYRPNVVELIRLIEISRLKMTTLLRNFSEENNDVYKIANVNAEKYAREHGLSYRYFALKSDIDYREQLRTSYFI